MKAFSAGHRGGMPTVHLIAHPGLSIHGIACGEQPSYECVCVVIVLCQSNEASYFDPKGLLLDL